MYKYKDKEFEIIEMTSPSNRLSWGTPFGSRVVDQAEWRTGVYLEKVILNHPL